MAASQQQMQEEIKKMREYIQEMEQNRNSMFRHMQKMEQEIQAKDSAAYNEGYIRGYNERSDETPQIDILTSVNTKLSELIALFDRDLKRDPTTNKITAKSATFLHNIYKEFSALKTTIDTVISDIDARASQNPEKNYTYETVGNDTVYKNSKGEQININTIDDDTMTKIRNNVPNLLNPLYEPDNLELNSANINTIQSRLINCQYLELLYLAKHDELLKIFRFATDLFDKYKYAIKIILWILANLRRSQYPPKPEPKPQTYSRDQYKPSYDSPSPSATDCPTINLPKPIISSIKELLKDQSKIQNIIGLMKDQIEPTHGQLKTETGLEEVP